MKWCLYFEQLVTQTTGLSLQWLGPVEAGGEGSMELNTCPQPWKLLCLGKLKVLEMPREPFLIPATV